MTPPRFFVLVAIVVGGLLWLAQWQFARYGEALAHEALQAQHRSAAPQIIRDRQDITPDLEYRALRLLGRFDTSPPQYLWLANARLGAGWVVVSPFRLAAGGALMVERGFLHAQDFAPGSVEPHRLPKQKPQWLDVRLYIAPPVSRFTPREGNEQGVWYARDPLGMLTHARLAMSAPTPAAMFAIATGPVSVSGDSWDALLPAPPFIPTTLAPARHLGYAATWAGLAIVFMAASGLYYWQQRGQA